jgi:hypothetical protein
VPATAKPKFELGQLVTTPGAMQALSRNGAHEDPYVRRHQAGDWGDDLDSYDREANDTALAQDLPLTSAYTLKDGTRLWIITEADRSATTILLPEEY